MTNIPIKLGLGKPNFRLMSTLFFFKSMHHFIYLTVSNPKTKTCDLLLFNFTSCEYYEQFT